MKTCFFQVSLLFMAFVHTTKNSIDFHSFFSKGFSSVLVKWKWTIFLSPWLKLLPYLKTLQMIWTNMILFALTALNTYTCWSIISRLNVIDHVVLIGKISWTAYISTNKCLLGYYFRFQTFEERFKGKSNRILTLK